MKLGGETSDETTYACSSCCCTWVFFGKLSSVVHVRSRVWSVQSSHLVGRTVIRGKMINVLINVIAIHNFILCSFLILV